MPFAKLVSNREIYEEVIQTLVPKSQSFLWIATSDIKDLHVTRGKRAIPFLQVLSELVDQGVSIRLIHAKEPGPAFRKDYDRFPNLINGMEMILCPRTHFKLLVSDGKTAFTGSANLTGAGMGAKSPDRRNFEMGLLTDDPDHVRTIMSEFDRLWIGEHCHNCQRKAHCATYHELIG